MPIPIRCFKYECEKKWEDLIATSNVKVKHCTECRQNVHLCNTIVEWKLAKDNGWCVAVKNGLRDEGNNKVSRRKIVVPPTLGIPG